MQNINSGGVNFIVSGPRYFLLSSPEAKTRRSPAKILSAALSNCNQKAPVEPTDCRRCQNLVRREPPSVYLIRRNSASLTSA
jgi:hypothetical protein